MKLLELNVISGDRSIPYPFYVKRMVNAGYVGRDQQVVRAHIEELRREGIPPPSSVPILFPVLSHNITTEDHIEVFGNKTSGEAEFVLLFDGETILVGVGSDHTDRDLEKQSITKSKQICQNVLSSEVWRYEDVKSNWDDLVIQSWVKPDKKEERVLYQKAPLGTILPPADLMDLVRSRLKDGQSDGLIIFSGTIPFLVSEIIHGSSFRAELIDPHLRRTLTCDYRVVKLDYLEGVE